MTVATTMSLMMTMALTKIAKKMKTKEMKTKARMKMNAEGMKMRKTTDQTRRLRVSMAILILLVLLKMTCKEDESMSHSCRLHASHWTTLINNQRFRLRQIVEARLRSIFEVTPSLPLFMTILSISGNVPEAQQWLFSTISQNAPHTSETLVAALEIFAAETEVPRVLALLDSYSYLLRPRDAHSLQLATITISESPKYHARAIPIIIKELADSIREIHVAVRSVYSHIDEAKHQRELVEILKLRAGRVRRERMEAWVEAVSSPPGPMHPMALAAAMMMGLPIPPLGAQGEDPDVVAMLDLSPAHDRDLEDLREEFRPRLGERFDGWRKVANDTKGGSKLLADAHARAVKLMPFLRATDAVRALLTEYVLQFVFCLWE